MAFGASLFWTIFELVSSVWKLWTAFRLERRLYQQLQVVWVGWTSVLTMEQVDHERILDWSLFLRPARRVIDFRPTPDVLAGRTQA